MWVSGLALLIIYTVSLFHLEGERFDWTEYLLLGTLFPALLVALSVLERLRPSLSSALRGIRLGLLAFLLLLPIFTIRHKNFKYVLIITVVQWLIALQYFKRSTEAKDPESYNIRIRILQALPALFVIMMSWVVATRYIWWTTSEIYILGSNLSFVIFILALLLVIVNLYDHRPALDDERRNPLRLIGNSLAILLIAMASVRTDHIFGLGEMFHWLSYTGPAESVRQGGWLLWDVPSHYGFLSILTLAWLPTATAWQSLFVVNALFNFLIALMIFFLFRALRPGLLNLCFALAMTLAAVFFRSGLAPYYLGPNHLPNIGGLRFFWCFVLVAILFWEYRHDDASGRWQRRYFWGGSLVWLIGTLWSSESAVYCSVIWLPAFALLVWRRAAASVGSETSFKTRLRASARWLLLPLQLLFGALVLITSFYFLRLGHAPDWRSFLEYAWEYSGGFMALPMNITGEVWVLILIFCALATTAVYFLRERPASRALPLILGAGGGFWATCSYFVSRSHPNNVHNLSAIFCGVIGLMLYLLARERKDALWSILVRSSFVPILTIVLVAVFANKGALTDYILSPQSSYLKVEQLIPISDPELDTLLNSAGVKPNDPIVYVGQSDLLVLSAWTFAPGDKSEVLTTYRSWLPIPLYSFVPLKDERRTTYLSRFASRTRLGGWLIEFKNKEPIFPWLTDYLNLHYVPGRTFETARWKLTWYEYKG